MHVGTALPRAIVTGSLGYYIWALWLGTVGAMKGFPEAWSEGSSQALGSGQGGSPRTQLLSPGTTKPLSGRGTGTELAGAESSNFTFDCGAKLPGTS